jgi:tetratricopeptide (TPR) repeat protein
MLIFICLLLLPSTLGLANQIDANSRVEVGIINFLYLHNNGYESANNSKHEIETSVLFPALESEIKQYGMSNYSIKFEKVITGNLQYAELAETKSAFYKSNGESYDLSVWGLVKPINGSSHYDLDLVIFVDSHILMRTAIKVRNNRISLWDGKKCNLSQDALSILPGVFAYALNHQNGQNMTDQVKNEISKRLNLLPKTIGKNTMTIIRNRSNQKDSGSDKNVGQVEFVYESGIENKVSIDQSTYDLIQRFLTTNKSYNWYLDQGGVLMPEISIVLGTPDREISTSDFEMSYAEPRTPAQLQVGIVPFENNSESSDHDWLGFGFEYLLSNKFSHIPSYKLADRDAVLKFINSDSASVQVNGYEWTIDYTIGGSYASDNSHMEVDLTYLKPFTGTQLASEHYLVDYDEFFDIVDNAAKKFLRVTGIVLSEREEKLFNRKVTTSMKAFENFCMGYIENASPDKDEDDVINYFLAAIEEDAEFWGAYYNLGTTYYNRDEYTRALAQFNFIINRFPSFELAYLGRGLTYFQQKKFISAKADFETYAQYKPDDFRAYYYLGRTLNQLKKYADALKYLNKSIELNPSYGRNYFELGNIYYSMNRFRPAITQYQTALKMEPNHMESHKRLGESFYRMHNFSGAINEFNVVLAVQPTDAESNFMLGVTVYKQALLDEYIDAFLEMYGLLDNEEIASNKVKHDKEQVRVYNEMTKRFYLAQDSRNNFYEATFNLALTYQERGIVDSALIFYNKTLQIKPNLTKARVVLAKYYEKQEEMDKALKEYKVVVRNDPDYFIGYSNLGPLYDEMDIVAVVVEELETEVRADPHNVDSSLSLASIYHAQGFNGKAATLYRRVLSIYPEHKKAKVMLARINGHD